jgi:alkyl hydroperoxide reductase subunit D
MPDYAKDIKINLKNVLDSERSRLSSKQIAIVSLACALAAKHKDIISAIEENAKLVLDEKEINAAKGSAVIMGMNNIYYRFTHLASNKSYEKMPVGLRMQVIANHGIEKLDFELACLAVSSINGCGMCIDSHESVLKNEGFDEGQIQDAIKIASVINATSFAL